MKKENNISLKELFFNNKKAIIFNKKLIEKPYSRYIKIGGIGENIFSDFCSNNGLSFINMRTFSYILLIYGRKKQDWDLSTNEIGAYRKYKVDKIMDMFSKEQLGFLEKNYQNLEYNNNVDTSGLPDFLVWDKNGNFLFVEIKTGSSTLSNTQRKTMLKMCKLFEIYVCHIAFDVFVKDLDIKNIDFGFVKLHENMEFGGGYAERGLYEESHVKAKKKK